MSWSLIRVKRLTVKGQEVNFVFHFFLGLMNISLKL